MDPPPSAAGEKAAAAGEKQLQQNGTSEAATKAKGALPSNRSKNRSKKTAATYKLELGVKKATRANR